MTDRLPPTRQDLIRWSEALSGIARTGLGFTESLYERERFEEVLAVAGDIRAAAAADEGFDAEHYIDEWMKGVGEGVAGYVTPKVAVGAVVYNDAHEILLVQRADSGIWLYPTGWADVGWFAESAMPDPLAGADQWRRHAFAAIRGEDVGVLYDAPRDEPWAGTEAHPGD